MVLRLRKDRLLRVAQSAAIFNKCIWTLGGQHVLILTRRFPGTCRHLRESAEVWSLSRPSTAKKSVCSMLASWVRLLAGTNLPEVVHILLGARATKLINSERLLTLRRMLQIQTSREAAASLRRIEPLLHLLSRICCRREHRMILASCCTD